MKKILMISLLLFAGPSFAGAPVVTPAVNADLETFQDKLDNPQLVRFGVDGRVNMVYGYGYSNWSIIDGNDGLVIVDAGWFIERSKQALADFRKSQNNHKPIKAIIFTHMHADHIAGVDGLFEAGEIENVDIYAQADWQKRLKYSAESGQMLMRRGMSQMGFLLPYKDLEKGTFGTGIGREALRGGTQSATHMPTVSVDVSSENPGPVKTTIAGIPMEFYYAPSDMDEQLLVWLPEDKVALVGDALGGTLPYVITPRHEPERKPESFLHTFKQILALDAENVIPGHGRPLKGSADITAVVNSNYEVITFLHDQVRRYINLGYSADQIIDEVKLPPHLADNPDLQAHYHRLAWLIRGLYTNEAGWVQNINSLTQHTASEQAKRLIKLVGKDTLLAASAKAIEEKDYRWSISLSQMILDAEPNNTEARQLMIAGLQGVAYTTNSGGERNYVLSEAGTVAGVVNWDQIFSVVTGPRWKQRDAIATFNQFGRRFQSRQSYGQTFTVQFNVAGEGSFSFMVNDGVLLYEPIASEKADSVINMDLDTVRNIGAKKLSLSEALQLEQTEITGGKNYAEIFGSLIQ